MSATRPGNATRDFLSKGFVSHPPAGKASLAFALAGSILAFTAIEADAGHSACTPEAGIHAVDTATPVNARFLAGLKSAGIGTVVRYYDLPDETIRGKTLTPAEVKLIGQAQMKVAVVFQHHNDKVETFLDPTRGTIDARRSLELAHRLGQPKGSTIYFGVDGVDSMFSALPQMRGRAGAERYGMSFIRNYFQQANAVLKSSGYKVGVYGSGLVCKTLMDAGMADKCWLANARGWPGYAAAENSRMWSMKQGRTIPARSCFGVAVDPNVVQAGHEKDFGAWAPGVQTAERRPGPQTPSRNATAAPEATPRRQTVAAATPVNHDAVPRDAWETEPLEESLRPSLRP